MEITHAMTSFAALSQDTVLKAFRLLVSHEPKGLAACEMARSYLCRKIQCQPLSYAGAIGLVISERPNRRIIYRAPLSHMQTVIEFLL